MEKPLRSAFSSQQEASEIFRRAYLSQQRASETFRRTYLSQQWASETFRRAFLRQQRASESFRRALLSPQRSSDLFRWGLLSQQHQRGARESVAGLSLREISPFQKPCRRIQNPKQRSRSPGSTASPSPPRLPAQIHGPTQSRWQKLGWSGRFSWSDR